MLDDIGSDRTPEPLGAPRTATGRRLGHQQKEFLLLLAFTLTRHNYAGRAVKLYRALSAIDPEDAYVWRCLAHAALLAGNAEESLDACERALRIEKNTDHRDKIELIRGKALWKLGRSLEARQCVEAALGLHQGGPRDAK